MHVQVHPNQTHRLTVTAVLLIQGELLWVVRDTEFLQQNLNKLCRQAGRQGKREGGRKGGREGRRKGGRGTIDTCSLTT